MKKVLNSIGYGFYLIVFLIIALELILRFVYPIETRINSGKVVLPKNQKYFLPNQNFTKIQKNAVHSKNSWGFRGVEWDPETTKTKILFVGGSTTECFYVDDNKTWVSKFSEGLEEDFLINNAGLNGHSTIGHRALLEGYIKQIKPNYVFFLVGINDLAVTENGGNPFDNMSSGWANKILKWEEKSRLLNLFHMLYRSYQAKKMDLADNMEWDMNTKEENFQFDATRKAQIFDKHKQGQSEYKRRLEELIKICTEAQAQPIFITQPLLFGHGVDPSSGKDLRTFKIYGLTGEEYLEKLDLYNKTLKHLTQQKGIACIDLAFLLPKDSKYYIDDMHFSDAGAEKIAEILRENIEFDNNGKLEIK